MTIEELEKQWLEIALTPLDAKNSMQTMFLEKERDRAIVLFAKKNMLALLEVAKAVKELGPGAWHTIIGDESFAEMFGEREEENED